MPTSGQIDMRGPMHSFCKYANVRKSIKPIFRIVSMRIIFIYKTHRAKCKNNFFAYQTFDFADTCTLISRCTIFTYFFPSFQYFSGTSNNFRINWNRLDFKGISPRKAVALKAMRLRTSSKTSWELIFIKRGLDMSNPFTCSAAKKCLMYCIRRKHSRGRIRKAHHILNYSALIASIARPWSAS